MKSNHEKLIVLFWRSFNRSISFYDCLNEQLSKWTNKPINKEFWLLAKEQKIPFPTTYRKI